MMRPIQPLLSRHGIPGTNNNDDLCQSLRRMGCVVIRLYHRGAWGSAGTYSFSHCLEDTEAVLSYLATGGTDRYAIDPLRVFLLGHSNGGNTVINVAKRHPELRGVIAYCPFDHKGRKPFSEKKALPPCSQKRPQSFISKAPKR